MKFKVLISFIVLLLAIFTIGCSGQASNSNEIHKEITGNVVEIDMIAKNWDFEPSTIEVNYGDNVKIHVKSIDVAHSLVIPEFGINEKFKANEKIDFEFVADRKGTFIFACGVPCGSEHSRMRGKLIVI